MKDLIAIPTVDIDDSIRRDMVLLDADMRIASQILDSLIMAPIGLGYDDVVGRRTEQMRRLMSRPQVDIKPLPRRSPRPTRTQKKHKLKGLRP